MKNDEKCMKMNEKLMANAWEIEEKMMKMDEKTDEKIMENE